MENEDYSVGSHLLETRVRDFHLAATMLPANVRILSKLFAGTLGSSSGKVLMAYKAMLDSLQAGNDTHSTQRLVKRVIDRESKIDFKIPFLKPMRARLCGLVALNHSGYFDTETQLYEALLNDLTGNRYTTEELAESIQHLGESKSSTYAPILQAKRENIHDFGVLMGIDDDKKRLEELTEQMPEKLRDYFQKVARLHRGGKLGISWPIPFKAFSSSIRSGLQGDTPCYSLQRGIGEDYGFTNPKENNCSYHLLLKQMDRKVKPDNSLRNLGALPAAYFYLNGLQAYAGQISDKIPMEFVAYPHIICPAITAAASIVSSATSSAGSSPRNEKAFLTMGLTGLTCFTSLITSC